ncbi:hypothetical protein [Aliiroseovarius sp.]|uniref:hypothetical protein n=1 Tax=Aliiroseovarius sp. TaxID=1872442 RepID=UPI00260C1C6F|nr:hypothetical protein [Aliiroseovarius sp.]
MKSGTFFRRIGGVVLALGVAVSATVASAETPVGSTVESRVLMGFQVNPDAIADWLPEGVVPITLPKGGLAGSNVILALIDRHLIMDAEGAPAEPRAGAIAAFLVYGKSEAGVRGYVTRVYEPAPIQDPYGNSAAGVVDHAVATETAGDASQRRERWAVRPDGGGGFNLELRHVQGALGWSEAGESRPYSSVTPDFFRIYRYDQLAELVMNAKLGRELNGEVSWQMNIAELADVFDGSEELTAIVSIPVYIREISLP